MKRMLTFAALLACSTASHASLLVNGSFEAPVVGGPCCITSPPTPIPGWTATPNVNVVLGTFASSAGNLAQDGLQYLDLVGQGGTGGISQTFSSVSGQLYDLSFYYSHNLFNSAVPSASAAFSVGSLSGTVSHSTGSNSNLDWRLFTGSFVGTGSPMTLSFVNQTGGQNEGVFLDNVRISAAVPEPGTWLQMLIGFGVIGGGFRAARRRQVASLRTA